MADGSYERRGPREAELQRLRRIIEEARRARTASASLPSAGVQDDMRFGKISTNASRAQERGTEPVDGV